MNVLKVEMLLPDDETIVINKAKLRRDAVPAYSCIGGNMDYKTKTAGYPELFSVLKNLSKISTWFFWSLVEKRNSTTNECVFISNSDSESKRITRAYKELNSLSLIKRTQQQHYMINPSVLFPSQGNYAAVLDVWNKL